ncbi:SANT/Myb domain [Sesbania bispinosa]|nr:SANT/Myb domain [Sesbania bispinosa]
MPSRNPFLRNESTTRRRSPRLLLQHSHNTPNPNSTNKPSVQSRDCSTGLRISPKLNNGVALRRSPRFSNNKAPTKDQGGEKSSKSGDSGKSTKVKGREAKTEENCVVADEEIAVEGGGKGNSREGNKIEVGAKRKRGGEKTAKGWTKEQELALKTAYFTAKPSPHFWKNVSKLVPGKSQQDCFDRVHRDFMTPPQSQPRSRARTIKSSSPLHQFSISASKLLKPIDKTVRRSNFLKQKSYITQKSIEKLLQRHLKVDQDRDGDIFSVLEPNIEFSTNALQPSQAFSTPKQQKENKGLLQSCTEASSSSSHKKPLSRFSGSSVSDLVSPPVLKQVKNKVQHEKYINQLRCREAKRRAASARSKMPITGQLIGEGSSIQKRDAVKAAKIALVSEARDAISKFQLSQINFMGNSCSSDEENDDGIGVDCESQ